MLYGGTRSLDCIERAGSTLIRGRWCQSVFRSLSRDKHSTDYFMRSLKKNTKAKKSSWEKAPKNYVSVNVDATLNQDTKRSATGIVLRDHCGKFIAVRNRKIMHVLDPATSKARRVRIGEPDHGV